MELDDIFIEMQRFFLDLGQVAIVNQAGIKVDMKDVDQPVTATDRYGSTLFRERFYRWVNLPGHEILDEESKNRVPALVLQESEYQWVLDPIDGTAAYAMGRDRWGISLALLRRGKPVMGGIYLPMLDEMLISDGKKAWRIYKRGTAREELRAVELPMTRSTFLEMFLETYFATCIAEGRGLPDLTMRFHTPESSVQGIYSTMRNQSAGMVLRPGFFAWDLAGGHALAKTAGFKIISLDDGREFRFDAGNFGPDWKLVGNWVICHPAHYEYIANALKG